MQQFTAMGGVCSVRQKDVNGNKEPLVTDNGQHIVDVLNLKISDPLAFNPQ